MGDNVEVIILASGSKGNALSITNEGKHILIDVGISFLILSNKLNEQGINVDDIDTLLLTHEHHDHTKGLKTLLKKNNNIKVYLTLGTYQGLSDDVKETLINYEIINSEESFKLENNLLVTPFLVSHDANEPVGFIIENDLKKVVLATDTGYIDEAYFGILKNADLYILEANHSTELLMKSSRPFHLKRRIVSEKGHLSNQEAAWLVNNFISERNQVIWAVAHISEDCNTVLEIEKTIVKVFDDPTKLIIKYTSQQTLEKIKL
ncbi:MBL fold metallo-hydrolase [Haploplasma axanthum]|nr:MBL fold metallo-hydrolase [Haploplasma axanthum]